MQYSLSATWYQQCIDFVSKLQNFVFCWTSTCVLFYLYIENKFGSKCCVCLHHQTFDTVSCRFNGMHLMHSNLINTMSECTTIRSQHLLLLMMLLMTLVPRPRTRQVGNLHKNTHFAILNDNTRNLPIWREKKAPNNKLHNLFSWMSANCC